MILKEKKNKITLLNLDSKGQMSIFFSTTIIVLITFIAFVVNIGMFVKAKINLQNSVDAAAWSGAAVQSRQLTDIAYLNWEMRNAYKEWMFKYYVLGNLSIPAISESGGGAVDFRAKELFNVRDNYNLPSVCINFASSSDSVDICQNATVAGLPDFTPLTTPGISDTATAFINSIQSEKVKDCGARSQVNFLTANMWAYNVLAEDPSAQGLTYSAPKIAQNFSGAFPKAFELALRIRNLENMVNKNPFSGGVCANLGASENCSTALTELSGQNELALERVVKAFYAGYRNIGHGAEDEMKQSFTLTELPPTVYNIDNEFSNSKILIPPGSASNPKQYLDLQLQTANLATFFTGFTSNFGILDGTQLVGQCDITKIAVPVPGYPIGYIKNPDVVTYYAVKGEAKWIGLFNPFTAVRDGGIKLTAYAAAKPFGGRIGPALFDLKQSDSSITARAGSGKQRSAGYVIGLDTSDLANTTGYSPGAPLPLNFNGADFWLNSPEQVIGGKGAQASNVIFSIPNIVYDYPNSTPQDFDQYSIPADGQLPVHKVDGALTTGLYNREILEKFKSLLPGLGTGVLSDNDITEAIERVKAPTLYDMYNYLVPTPDSLHASIQPIHESYGTYKDSGNSHQWSVFAPLVSDMNGSLYTNTGSILSALNGFIEQQEQAMKKYTQALNRAAYEIGSQRSLSNAQIGIEGARFFSDYDEALPVDQQYLNEPTDASKPTCKSIAGRFAYFYMGERASSFVNINHPSCTSKVTLGETMANEWATNSSNRYGEIYTGTFRVDEVNQVDFRRALSAYSPGPFNDADLAGVWTRAFDSRSVSMQRNYYSTKFVSLKSLLNSGTYSTSNFPIYSEEKSTRLQNIGSKNYKNSLSIPGDILQNIDH